MTCVGADTGFTCKTFSVSLQEPLQSGARYLRYRVVGIGFAFTRLNVTAPFERLPIGQPLCSRFQSSDDGVYSVSNERGNAEIINFG